MPQNRTRESVLEREVHIVTLGSRGETARFTIALSNNIKSLGRLMFGKEMKCEDAKKHPNQIGIKSKSESVWSWYLLGSRGAQQIAHCCCSRSIKR